MSDRIDVKTKAAAEKALKAGKSIRITAGRFTLALVDLGVNIEVCPSADIQISLTDCGDYSSPAELWGSSSAELWGSSSAVLRGSSRAVLRGSSSAVLRESSSAVLRESSSAEAYGYSMVQARGPKVSLTASDQVAVNLWGGAKAKGGRQQIVTLASPKDWCDYYGVRVEDGCAIVYKGVREGYRSSHGVVYAPGTIPSDPVFSNAGECERGGGLNFSPTPRHTHDFESNPAHYLECRVRLEDMIVRFDGTYPQKVQAKECAVPVVEVNVDGEPIVSAPAEQVAS